MVEPSFMKNIACNLIYNDGDEGVYVGFNGRCSIENIINNVEAGISRWCSQPQCNCRKFYDNNFKGSFPGTYPNCTESVIFENWEFNPGFTFVGNIPFVMHKVGKGKVAILTTKFSGDDESERKIIGLFKIKDVLDNKHGVTSYSRYRLRLTLEEAKQVDFWAYYRNTKDLIPRWSQPRFRYLADNQVAAILHDLISIVKNDSKKSMLLDLLKKDFQEYSGKKPEVQGAINENIPHKVALKRKYGLGGESEEHKSLKKYIANHPEAVNLNPLKVRSKLEHQYVSGDCVDILFEPTSGNQNAVVEIELDRVLPGIHQAIKYRALRCAELGVDLDSDKVKAKIVAWAFTIQEVELCRKYNIEYFKLKL